MIIANYSHTIIKNRFGKKTNGIEDILKIFMVRTYSFILSYYTLVIIPLLVTLSTFRRMEEDFMDCIW